MQDDANLRKVYSPPPRFAFVFHLQEYKYSPTTTETLKKSTLKIKKVSAADLLRAAVELRQVTIFQKEIWPPAALSREAGIHVKSCFL